MSSDMLGRDLGPYRVLGPLGAGGMGEVYRARDTKLGRDVAIKILPAHLLTDPERRARFTREARHLATLNHPHIGAIYGLEEHGDLTALVLELVEGPTLAQKLQRGPLKVHEAVAIARQIAEALDAAHDKGIVHRDLKPANIVLQDGSSSGEMRAKVLDFGIAKSVLVSEKADVTETQADRTADGRILGTPAYMSPEQARGEAVDKRTDIWAFGCVMFEMLTGRRPFQGNTATETIARILERDLDWSVLPVDTPAHVRRLLERCLRKDPRKRLRDIADARLELDDVGQESGAVTNADAPKVAWWRRPAIAWIAAGAMGIALGAMTIRQLIGDRTASLSPGSTQTLEFTIAPPEPWSYPSELPAPNFEISPDGQYLVVVAVTKDVPMLWVRPIANPSWRMLPGTDHAYGPFWSPDSKSVGFFTKRELKAVTVHGGSPVTVCTTPDTGAENSGGAWSTKGVILFGGLSAIMRVPASGGEVAPATKLEGPVIAHRWPSFLPDGEHFLFVSQAIAGVVEMRVGALGSPTSESLGPTTSHVVHAANHLFYVRNGRLVMQPFDVTARRTTGEPQAITEQTADVSPQMRGQFTIATSSANGVFAHSTVGRPMYDLTWKDRTGVVTGTDGEPGIYFNLNLSQDEQRITASRFWNAPTRGWGVDIWVVDRAGAGTSTRLTFDPAREGDPVWSPDGAQIVFNSARAPGFSLYRHAANGGGSDEMILASDDGALVGPDWSTDGRFLLYSKWGKGRSLWVLPLTGDRKPAPFLETPFDVSAGVFSPDGRWVAYESDESGRKNVYVRPFPSGSDQFRISRDGGRAPRWRGDGRELFFLAPDGTMMAAAIETGTTMRADLPQALFQTGLNDVIEHVHPYAVLRNGQRFLMPVKREPPSHAPITVVWNWPALVRPSP